MITDSGTFKFTIVDTSSHTSLVLLHKQTRVSKENHKGLTKIIFHQLLQSLNFYGTMVSSTGISSLPTLLLKQEGVPKGSSEHTGRSSYNKIFPNSRTF